MSTGWSRPPNLPLSLAGPRPGAGEPGGRRCARHPPLRQLKHCDQSVTGRQCLTSHLRVRGRPAGAAGGGHVASGDVLLCQLPTGVQQSGRHLHHDVDFRYFFRFSHISLSTSRAQTCFSCFDLLTKNGNLNLDLSYLCTN